MLKRSERSSRLVARSELPPPQRPRPSRLGCVRTGAAAACRPFLQTSSLHSQAEPQAFSSKWHAQRDVAHMLVGPQVQPEAPRGMVIGLRIKKKTLARAQGHAWCRTMRARERSTTQSLSPKRCGAGSKVSNCTAARPKIGTRPRALNISAKPSLIFLRPISGPGLL